MHDASSLELVPIALRAANAYVERMHRHHRPSRGHKFSIAAQNWLGEVVGVAIVGRPVSRLLDDGFTLEVNRLCSDGSDNVCSFLYGASRRAAKEMGYRRIITYTLPSEGGASLRGAGWVRDGVFGGGTWGRRSRAREDKHPTEEKVRWSAKLK